MSAYTDISRVKKLEPRSLSRELEPVHTFIPPEIFALIIEHVNRHTTLFNLCLVSKEFYRMALPQLYKNIRLVQNQESDLKTHEAWNRVFLALLNGKARYVKSISMFAKYLTLADDLQEQQEEARQNLYSALMAMDQLASVSLFDTSADKWVSQVLYEVREKHRSTLKKLSIYTRNWSYFGAAKEIERPPQPQFSNLTPFSSLVSISLQVLSRIDELKLIEHLTSLSPSLKHLSYTWALPRTEADLEFLDTFFGAGSTMQSQLESLKFQIGHWWELALEPDDLPLEHYVLYKYLTNIKSLDIRDIYDSLDWLLNKPGFYIPTLRHLKIHARILLPLLTGFVKAHTELEEIDLTGRVSAFDDRSNLDHPGELYATILAQRRPALRVLRVHVDQRGKRPHCWMDHLMAERLALNCPNLEVLELTANISRDEWPGVLRGLAALRRLRCLTLDSGYTMGHDAAPAARHVVTRYTVHSDPAIATSAPVSHYDSDVSDSEDDEEMSDGENRSGDFETLPLSNESVAVAQILNAFSAYVAPVYCPEASRSELQVVRLRGGCTRQEMRTFWVFPYGKEADNVLPGASVPAYYETFEEGKGRRGER